MRKESKRAMDKAEKGGRDPLEEDADIYCYPANSPYNSMDGYYRRLTDTQKAALVEMQKWVVDTDVDMAALCRHTLHPYLTLLRYLRANGFDTDKAKEHMAKNIAWRKENRVDAIAASLPEDLLGCSLAALTRFFPHWHCGHDTQGRPVLYKQYGKFDVAKLKEITTMDAVMDYHVWEQEACLSLCVAESHQRGVIVDTVTAVMDLENMKLAQVRRV
jgi:hypothetical protein